MTALTQCCDFQLLASFILSSIIIYNTLCRISSAHSSVYHSSTRMCSGQSRPKSHLLFPLRDFEVKVANLKASEMWVNKFQSLNYLEELTCRQAELPCKHWTEMKTSGPTDCINLECTSSCISHTAKRISLLIIFGSTYAWEQLF